MCSVVVCIAQSLGDSNELSTISMRTYLPTLPHYMYVICIYLIYTHKTKAIPL